MEQTLATAQISFNFETAQPQIVRESRDELKLQLGEFDGPLDLLLYLIKQERANIFDIPIAKITDEYLKYIRLLKTYDLTVATDFLVMAATLIEIKSKMLLPRDILAAEEEEPEDPRQQLVQRLLEYEKFKSAAQMLHESATIEHAVYTRGRVDTDENNTETNATVFDLLKVFQKILDRHIEEIKLEIEREEVTLTEMLRNLKDRLKASRQVNILEFFAEMRTRRELVTAFIAVLEIVRTETIKLTQEKTFGDITLKRV